MYLSNELNIIRLHTLYNRLIKDDTLSKGDVVNLEEKAFEYISCLSPILTKLRHLGSRALIRSYYGINWELYIILFQSKEYETLVDVFSNVLVKIKNGSISGKLTHPSDFTFVKDDVDEMFTRPSILHILGVFKNLLSSNNFVTAEIIYNFYQDNGYILPTIGEIEYVMYQYYLDNESTVSFKRDIGGIAKYQLRSEVTYYVYHKDTNEGGFVTLSINEKNPRNKARDIYSKENGIAKRNLRGFKYD